MKLSEYINQENPIRMPQVFLEKGEYRIHDSIKVAGHVLTTIEIPVLWERFKTDPVYIHKDDEPRLYTRDEHSNPISRSCFYIKDLPAIDSPLEFGEWHSKFADEIAIELAESGADRELDFDPEREYEKRYEMYLNARK